VGGGRLAGGARSQAVAGGSVLWRSIDFGTLGLPAVCRPAGDSGPAGVVNWRRPRVPSQSLQPKAAMLIKPEVLRGVLSDARSGQVVFVSHCMLNQNVRYQGGATRPGVVDEVVARAATRRGGHRPDAVSGAARLGWGG
jgi:hypothetical protein